MVILYIDVKLRPKRKKLHEQNVLFQNFDTTPKKGS